MIAIAITQLTTLIRLYRSEKTKQRLGNRAPGLIDLHSNAPRLCKRDLRLNDRNRDHPTDNPYSFVLIRVHLRPSAANAFVLPVMRRINSTSSTMYGVPSLRKISWNQIDGSRSTYGFCHEI